MALGIRLAHLESVESCMRETASDFIAEFGKDTILESKNSIIVTLDSQSAEPVQVTFHLWCFDRASSNHDSFYWGIKGSVLGPPSASPVYRQWVYDYSPLYINFCSQHRKIEGLAFVDIGRDGKLEYIGWERAQSGGWLEDVGGPESGTELDWKSYCTSLYVEHGRLMWKDLIGDIRWDGCQKTLPPIPTRVPDGEVQYQQAMIAAGHTPVEGNRWL